MWISIVLQNPQRECETILQNINVISFENNEFHNLYAKVH